MSRKLKRAVSRLEYETETRVRQIGRLLEEYREELQSKEIPQDPTGQGTRQREIDRILEEYIHLNKQLRRVRRKA